MYKRRQARTYSFQFLYRLQYDEFINLKEALLNKEAKKDILEQTLHDFQATINESQLPSPQSFQFAVDLINGVLENYHQLEETIRAFTKNKRLDTIPKVDLTILLQAAFELTFMQETPARVVINEAIELAKKFSNKESGAFVNGILDKIAKQSTTSAPS